MKKIQLKICGIVPGKTDEKIQDMADMLGFIFYDQSDRYVDPEIHDRISKMTGIKKVGVFVNESIEKVIQLAQETGLTMVQLHGNESPDYCKQLLDHVAVIKTISVKDDQDLQFIETYNGSVNYFLFDTKAELRGGNGIKFNWDLLKKRKFKHPFFLSGGISEQDALLIKDYDHPDLAGIDINSCFEIRPGEKDLNLVDSFKKDLYG